MNARASAVVELDEQIDGQIDEQLEEQLSEYASGEIESEDVDFYFGTRAAANDAQQRAQQQDQSENKARRWMWGFLIALGAVQIYYVQEMLAALFLFTLAFAVFAVIALAFYAANRASQASLARVEPVARVAARAGRRTFGFIEYLSKKPFRRQHSETAP
jgi:cation transport ATPase